MLKVTDKENYSVSTKLGKLTMKALLYPLNAGGWLKMHSTVDIYLLKVKNGNTTTMCEICSELTIKTPKSRQWRRSSVFNVSIKQILHIVLVFISDLN